MDVQNKLGYACISLTLREGGYGFRTFRKANYTWDRLLEVTLNNLEVTRKILLWNVSRGIKMYRMTSELIPFMNVREIGMNSRLWSNIKFRRALESIGEIVVKSDTRLSMHPSYFTNLTSLRNDVRVNSYMDIALHAMILTECNGTDIIVHLGSAHGNKVESKNRAKLMLEHLAVRKAVASRLRIENDKVWNYKDLLDLGYPVVFDVLHHRYYHNQKELTQEVLEDWRVAQELCDATWNEKKPKIHLSQGRGYPVDYAHSDYIDLEYWRLVSSIFSNSDIMLECKAKDKAVLKILGIK